MYGSLRKLIVAGVLTCSLLAGTAMAYDRDDRGRCEQRIDKAQRNLRHAVRKHGARSRQAQKRREQLERVRQQCGMYGDRR
jgi:F0F1-type ATP synthase epsilon subunit